MRVRLKYQVCIMLFVVVCFLWYSAFCSFASKVFLNRAINLAHQEEFDKSFLYFKKSLSINHFDAEIHNECGEMFFFRAKNENDNINISKYLNIAQSYFKNAIQLNKYNAKYYLRLADLYTYMNDYIGVEMNFNEVDQLAPHFILYRLKRIKFYISEQVQQYDKALDELTFLLDNFHQFTFQNKQEKEHLLYGMKAHLEKIPPSQRFYDIKERIVTELIAIQK